MHDMTGIEMIIIKKYRILEKNQIYHVVSMEPRICPACSGPLKVRDTKRRGLILEDGDVRVFLLRRLKCETCGTLQLELPDIFVPYKHYSKAVIQNAVNGSHRFCPAENSTIYRWSREAQEGE